MDSLFRILAFHDPAKLLISVRKNLTYLFLADFFSVVKQPRHRAYRGFLCFLGRLKLKLNSHSSAV